MALKLPIIDDRNYDQILAEALARIPVHNPQWTNFNDSDPGVTLVQLFAFMMDNLLYRSNLIPERNRLKFLQLLGIPMQPATSAHGLVAFNNPRGALRAETLPAGLELRAGQTPFQTQDSVDVLPLETQMYYKRRLDEDEETAVPIFYAELYKSFATGSKKLAYYETALLQAPANGQDYPTINLMEDTWDGSLWVALLARETDNVAQARAAIAGKVLSLGILPRLDNAARVLAPGSIQADQEGDTLIYQMPIGESLPQDASQRVPRYRTLDARSSGDLLAEPGVVELPLPDSSGLHLWDNLEPTEQGTGDFPPSIEDTAVQQRVISWIRIKVRESAANEAARDAGLELETSEKAGQLKAQISWVGINTVRGVQRVDIFSENLGIGSGEPDQTYTLVNTPVLPDTVTLTVGGEQWLPLDDLMQAAPEVPVRSPQRLPSTQNDNSTTQSALVYKLDPEAGTIQFGNGLHGKRPPLGASIRVGYSYGGGRQGNVGIGALNKGANLPAGIKVSNPVATWGGDEAETAVNAERRIPGYLQHRERLVSQMDFEEITYQTPGVDLGRVNALALFHPELGSATAVGTVTILVIPKYDNAHPAAPEPDRLFLDTICNYLNPRRLITTELHVRGPEYTSIWLSVGIEVVPGYDIPPVREAVKTALRDFLSPLYGGFADEAGETFGWPLSKVVEKLELWAVATRVVGVSKVTDLLLAGLDGLAQERIPIIGLELPRLDGIVVQTGMPLPLDALLGDTATPATNDLFVPVPIIPAEC